MAQHLRASRLNSDRGAILIQVATMLVVFTAMSAFVVDYGVQLVSRNQIQNTVDAAALAGATSLAYDDPADWTATGPAELSARAVASKNPVWQEAASIPASKVEFPVCASSYDAGASGAPINACVQVTAFRDESHANAIPAIFGKLLGQNWFGVAATAIAEAKSGNATDCLKPLAIPDSWTERYPTNPGTWSPTSTFDKWDPTTGVLIPSASRDAYIAPDALEAGTGLKVTVDFGAVTLQPGSASFSGISPWLYLPVQIPDSRWGPNAVRANTNSCAAATVAIGDRLNFAAGGVAANALLIGEGLLELYDRDPGAHWNAATKRVEGSCADLLTGRCASMSPRVIALPVYDPIDLANSSHAGGATSVLVTNIVGFFIDSVTGTNATGYLTRHPGLRSATAIVLYDASSFLRASLLVK
jgi:putative Flp pilus-assembly TadE/G-like protein